jgi:predicted dehydrogenase
MCGMSLKVVLVGSGKIADGHVEEIQKMPERAQVVAVCDRELLMAEQLATRYGIPRFYDDYGRMLERGRPDVVHIATPPESHLALSRMAFDAGSHVYAEKPLALTHADSEALVASAEKARKKLTVGYTYLFDPPAMEMRRLLEEGAIGEVVHVDSWFGYSLSGPFGAAILGDPNHWVRKLPGKLFHNNIDHLLNKLLEFIDDDEPDIQTTAWRRRPAVGDGRDEIQDEMRLTIVGRRASAHGTFSAHVKPAAHFVRVYGTKAIAHVDYVSRTVTLDTGATLPSAIGRLVPAFGQAWQYAREGGRNAAAFARGDFQFFSGLNRLLAMFYDAIRDDGPLPISTRDMLRVSRWMDRIFAQMNRGERR